MPRGSNGKLDRASLTRRIVEREEKPAPSLAPSSQTEVALASLWRELLGVERVAVHDNFFDLGGHSLLVARLHHRLQRQFDLQLPLRRLFEAPTLGQLAALIDQSRRAGDGAAAGGPPDLLAESRLDVTIRPVAHSAPSRGSVEHVLMTGATGFVGCFLVDELLRRTNCTLHCLVRGHDADAGMERLRTRLRRLGLTAAAETTRLRPVLGDLSRPHFSLTAPAFDQLAESIDTVLHCGALVNFIYPYEALRPTNVEGTRELLRFAVRSRPKPVHHISTVGVFGGRGGGLYLEDDCLADGVLAHGAYSQSKWVAERLVLQARERGLLASIYRLGTVAGHSTAGISNESDFFWRLIRSCVRMGLAPDVHFTQDMTPIDYVARAVVHLAFNAQAGARNFHLISRDRFNWSELVGWLAEYGYPLRVVPAPEWIEAVRKDADRDGDNAFTPLLPLLSTMLTELEPAQAGITDGPVEEMRFDCRNVDTGLSGTPIACPSLGVGLVRGYLDYFVRAGVLAPPARSPRISLVAELDAFA
jgi:thioester reductase-like protein